MTIHKRVNYSKIASMILRATAMHGGRLRLKTVVRDICIQMGLGLSNTAVKEALGSYCQTIVYDRDDVRVVEDWVVYG